MQCNSCGRQLFPGTTTCPYCGAPVSTQNAPPTPSGTQSEFAEYGTPSAQLPFVPNSPTQPVQSPSMPAQPPSTQAQPPAGPGQSPSTPPWGTPPTQHMWGQPSAPGWPNPPAQQTPGQAQPSTPAWNNAPAQPAQPPSAPPWPNPVPPSGQLPSGPAWQAPSSRVPPAEQFQMAQGWQQFPAFREQPAWQQPPPQQQPQQTSPPQRRGSSPLLIAILVLLILILVGGAGLTWYLLAGRSSPNTTRATTPTTPTSTPAVTPSPTLNTNDPQALYNQVTATIPIFSEPLTTLNSGDWSGPDPAKCTFTSQGLRVNVTGNASTALCTASASNYSDFAYQVQMKIAKGQGGLVFRGNSAGVYLLEIDAQQQAYGLISITGGTSNVNGKILVSSQSSAINNVPNQTNLLAIIARGNKLYVYINKQFVNSVSDTTSSAGAIGVVCFRDTDITFSNAQVWTF